jgi:two-component system, cell cycle sensor histidine kinase and response regulator CckA
MKTTKKSRPFSVKGSLAILSVVIAIVLVAGGYGYYQKETGTLRKHAYEDLNAIAGMKTDQIIRWRKERIAETRFNAQAPFLRTVTAQWLKNPDQADLKKALLSRLQLIKEFHEDQNVILVGPDGRILVSLDPHLVYLEAQTSQLLAKTIHTREAVFGDFFRCPVCRQVHLDVAAPIPDPSGNPLAVLILRIDPEKFLYPLIQNWPTSSKSAETLLVRRQGPEVLFLNKLRHRTDPALSIRVPLSRLENPAVQATRGKIGLFEGNDYRDVPVIADIHPIADSPWFIVAKVDRKEILYEVVAHAWFITFLTLILILLCGVSLAFFYKHKGKRTFQALYEAEHEKAEILEEARVTLYSIGDAVITTEPDGRIRQMNPVAEKLTGWKEPEAVGKPLDAVFRIINESSRAPVENPVDRVLNEGLIIKLANHTVLISREGREYPIADSGAPIRNNPGEITGVVLVFRDRTEERRAQKALEEEIEKTKKAERALKISEEKFRLIFEHSLDGIFFTLVDGSVLAANPAACALLGRSEGEICNGGRDLVVDTSDPRLASSIRIREETGTFQGELNYKRKDGTTFPVELTAGRFSLSTGEERAYVICRDITDRKRAEADLFTSEERYRSLVEDSFDGIFIQKGPKILFANQRLYKMLGYPEGELVGLDHWLMYHADYQEITRERAKARMNGENPPAHYEVMLQRKDRTSFDGEVRVRIITIGEEPGLQVWVRDISERKRLEDQFYQAQKMESVGRLAGGVAHDFNNLLTVIIGNAEMGLTETSKEDSLHPFLMEIKEAGVRSANLARQLLAFSRKQILQTEWVNVNEIIQNLEKMLMRLIGEDIQLVTALVPDLGQIEADSGQIEQVITNLAVNARDAMPFGGKLMIETANVDLDEEYAAGHIAVTPGPYVLLSISDNGIGMTKEVQSQIFEPFFTTKEKGKGTGLGLATVYGIVKQSRGNIWVYSEVDQGTAFKIYLPRVQKDADWVEDKKPGVRISIQGDGQTILVVEDEESICELALKVLSKYGYRVLAARNGPEAMALYQGHNEPIDLLLTDVVMPKMYGKELADWLSRFQPDLQVLFMSGYTDNSIVHHGVLDKGVDFIQKPFTPEDLAGKVWEVLQRN